MFSVEDRATFLVKRCLKYTFTTLIGHREYAQYTVVHMVTNLITELLPLFNHRVQLWRVRNWTRAGGRSTVDSSSLISVPPDWPRVSAHSSELAWCLRTTRSSTPSSSWSCVTLDASRRQRDRGRSLGRWVWLKWMGVVRWVRSN